MDGTMLTFLLIALGCAALLGVFSHKKPAPEDPIITTRKSIYRSDEEAIMYYSLAAMRSTEFMYKAELRNACLQHISSLEKEKDADERVQLLLLTERVQSTDEAAFLENVLSTYGLKRPDYCAISDAEDKRYMDLCKRHETGDV